MYSRMRLRCDGRCSRWGAWMTTPAVLIRQLDAIRRLAPRLPDTCRQALSDQADAILETASVLVARDRSDLDAAWHRAHTALEALPQPSSGQQ
jgi:hypothetical protein